MRSKKKSGRPGAGWAVKATTALVGAGALISYGLLAATPSMAAASAGGSSSVSVRDLCSQNVAPGHAACLAEARTDIAHHMSVSPNATVAGFGPSQLQSAYALTSAASTGGTGQTVAIVDAYDDPNAAADLSTYRTQFGLPSCTTANGCFTKMSQTGSTTSLPSPAPSSDDWTGEESLDFDMVSAACPNCHILLVEANSDNDSDLGAAVNEAVAKGAKFVSNSYGGPEDSSETSEDSSYYDHPGVVVTVSSGDEAYGAEYPAASQYVTAVGGTSLKTASNTRGWTESVWKTSSTEGGGSGCSAYEAKPTWQTDTGCSKRTIADVSSDADPATGVAVYDSYNGNGGWNEYGGTSASSPFIASVYALAGTPAAGSNPASYPYAHAANLNDVTTGNNGSCSPTYLCTAGTGYDGPTGLGTPNGTAAFTSGGGGTGGNTVTVTNPGSKSTTVGTAVSTQISASDSASGQTLTYSATGLPTGLSISSSGLITGTPTTAGTYNVTVTAKDTTNATGSASFTWTVSTSGGGGGCTSGQLLGNPGFETGTASPWTASTGVVDDSSSEPAHTGSWKAWLDGYGSAHTDTLSQSVTIPAGCSATFSFYEHIDTQETGSTAYDTLKVQVGSTTLTTLSNANANSGYTQKSFSLSSYAGQTVTLKFTGTEDSSLATDFLIDDTAVNVS
ncbi:putative Ig domain-containing protein [Streptantibioticus silvisoli]|uniref:Ig domain-containing protein n=1 Tax=Streptantibioticus silvisoli TaxID=2705255 RepID=A0ABT6W3P1_9ACTN|nr:putative Ig domain-containing protein [Streptantibioticus silvisoli]MDI5965289.1 putative Ig domain-containing protein [Streptantibioticus silvisoli]